MLRQRRSEKEDSSYRLLFKDYFGGKLKKKKKNTLTSGMKIG